VSTRPDAGCPGSVATAPGWSSVPLVASPEYAIAIGIQGCYHYGIVVPTTTAATPRRGRYSRPACLPRVVVALGIASRNGLRCRTLSVCRLRRATCYRHATYARIRARVAIPIAVARSIPAYRSVPDICLPIVVAYWVRHHWHTRTSPRASLRSLGTPRLAVCSMDAKTSSTAHHSRLSGSTCSG